MPAAVTVMSPTRPWLLSAQRLRIPALLFSIQSNSFVLGGRMASAFARARVPPLISSDSDANPDADTTAPASDNPSLGEVSSGCGVTAIYSGNSGRLWIGCRHTARCASGSRAGLRIHVPAPSRGGPLIRDAEHLKFELPAMEVLRFRKVDRTWTESMSGLGSALRALLNTGFRDTDSGKGFGRRAWTRTRDPQLRRLMLYPPELRAQRLHGSNAIAEACHMPCLLRANIASGPPTFISRKLPW